MAGLLRQAGGANLSGTDANNSFTNMIPDGEISREHELVPVCMHALSRNQPGQD